MRDGTPRPTVADTTNQLVEQSRALFGERRTAELKAALADTARILTELRNDLPDRNVEPGFYP